MAWSCHWSHATSAAPSAENGGDAQPDLLARQRFLREHIFVHTHIPKTAGSSLSHALMAMVGGAHSLDERLRPKRKIGSLSADERAALAYVGGHIKYGTHERFAQTPLYVAAVRDPVERAVSYYRYVCDTPGHPNHAHFASCNLEEAWDQMDGRAAATRAEEQSRILCGLDWDAPLDPKLLWQRVESDYFLLIPHDQVSDTVVRLRRAFGMPVAPTLTVNASRSARPEVSPVFAEKVRAANPLDSELVARVRGSYADRIEQSCDYIASYCLRQD